MQKWIENHYFRIDICYHHRMEPSKFNHNDQICRTKEKVESCATDNKFQLLKEVVK